jgi:RNA polymerase sigma factor (sigma-70 family)
VAISSSEFANAYELGYPKTVRFLLSRGLSPDLAQEMSQAGWVRGWQMRRQLHHVDKIVAWVNQISLNLFRNQLAHVAYPSTTTPQSRPEIDSIVIDVRTALEKSSARERDLLRSYYLEGYSSDELGAREKCSPGAIRVRVLRAKLRVIETLEGGYRPARKQRTSSKSGRKTAA